MPRETQQPINVDNIILKLLKGFLENERKVKTETDFVYKKVDNVKLTEKEMSALCYKAREIFLSQPVLLELDAPIKVLGDIHGQYYDLLQVLKRGGFPPEANYLFLGDYVDRGRQSLETMSLLLAYKIKYPENFFILRGNHECASITRIYGFFEECKKRYRSIKLWKTFVDVFNCLPVAAIIDDKIFCCHGGISPELVSMDQIRRIHRPSDIPDNGLLCDILWADPEEGLQGWGINDRGVSYTFGADMVARFLHKHNFDLICRAHQVVQDGYEFFAKRQVVTVFSAPNYCDEFDNAAAMMIVDEELMCSFEIFTPKKLYFEKLKPVSSNKDLESKEKETNNNNTNNNNEEKKGKAKETKAEEPEKVEVEEEVEDSDQISENRDSERGGQLNQEEQQNEEKVGKSKKKSSDEPSRKSKLFEKFKNFTSMSSSSSSSKKNENKIEAPSPLPAEEEIEPRFEIEE